MLIFIRTKKIKESLAVKQKRKKSRLERFLYSALFIFETLA